MKDVLTRLVHTLNEIPEKTTSQIKVWDGAVNRQIRKLDNWHLNFMKSKDALSLQSMPRLHPRLTMNSQNHPFSESYTIRREWLTVEKVQDVRTGVEWKDRTSLEKELLTLMGKSGVKHLSPAFSIVKVKWTKRKGYSLPYARLDALGKTASVTVASFIKPIEGELPYGHYASGLKSDKKWQLCGRHISGSSNSYIHTHPYTRGAENGGSLYLALPATVDRYVDLRDPTNWGSFIGGN